MYYRAKLNPHGREDRFDKANEMVYIDTIIDHKDKILRALTYIENNLHHPLLSKNIAKVACQSQFHFHRKFSYYIGDTVSGYIRNRRLTKAVKILQSTNQSITDVAFSLGYGTTEAFTKAFKRAFGIPPSLFKKQKRSTINSPRRFCALILRPLRGKNYIAGSGREGYCELFKMANQIQLNIPDSTWISVFPDTYSINGINGGKQSLLHVDFGPLRYQIIFPKNHTEFEILRSGKHAVLHMNGEIIIYRSSEEVVPNRYGQKPKHLERLPIGYRSILVVSS